MLARCLDAHFDELPRLELVSVADVHNAIDLGRIGAGACDRAVVIFGGQVVDTIPAAEADEPTLMRAAYGLPRDAAAPAHTAPRAASPSA